MAKVKSNTPFEEFLRINGITGKAIADYLDVSGAFISQLRTGKAQLPENHLMRILENKEWDSQPLIEQRGNGNIAAGRDINLAPDYKKLVDALNESLKQNSRLIGIIEKMHNK